ncbi:nucleoside phosphorylase domain-containing protein [Apiospora saccharicola]
MATHEDYAVAVICAIGYEMSAVRYMLDVEHPRLPAKDGDSNIYILGQLSGHNVVLACLPGIQGKGAAATVVTNMSRTFPQIEWRFLVGIGGGIPSGKHDIRLGDVVVSMPEGPYGGVVQYDLGKDRDDGFQLKGFLSAPPSRLRNAVEMMRSDHLLQDSKAEEYISAMLRRGQGPGARKGRGLSQFARPPADTDILFDPDYPHDPTCSTCEDCDTTRVVPRTDRDFDSPEIHYGLIASGDRVLKSAMKRDKEVQQLGDVLCFEMEAAGLMTDFSCIVIRGISDYADSHKNDRWHHYAAAAAAACAKELLTYVDPEKCGAANPSSSGGK